MFPINYLCIRTWRKELPKVWSSSPRMNVADESDCPALTCNFSPALAGITSFTAIADMPLAKRALLSWTTIDNVQIDTANSEQRTANSEQRTANSEQRTANSEQRTAHSAQRTANSEQLEVRNILTTTRTANSEQRLRIIINRSSARTARRPELARTPIFMMQQARKGRN